ncbi:hypothetical protein O9993_15165 [Vibrio lentus]|nr:hypothetical protein [Vibrio lentus]
MNFSGTTKRFENSAASSPSLRWGVTHQWRSASGNRNRDRRSMAKRHDGLKWFE